MRKVLNSIPALLCIALLTGATIPAMGQNVKMRIPIIRLGLLPIPEMKNGKSLPIVTTRYRVLKNALLTADVNNCRVTSYKFSMIAPGKGFYGPVYVSGGDLTDSMKRVIRNTDGPNVKLYFEEIRMLYRGDTMDANPVYIQYDE